jgi:uncharacterized protein (TIGR02246 family)
MQFIFDGLFKGSKHKSRSIEFARFVSDDAIIALSTVAVSVSNGPMSPETRNRQTFLLVRADGVWRIRHWQNTTIREPD